MIPMTIAAARALVVRNLAGGTADASAIEFMSKQLMLLSERFETTGKRSMLYLIADWYAGSRTLGELSRATSEELSA